MINLQSNFNNNNYNLKTPTNNIKPSFAITCPNSEINNRKLIDSGN